MQAPVARWAGVHAWIYMRALSSPAACRLLAPEAEAHVQPGADCHPAQPGPHKPGAHDAAARQQGAPSGGRRWGPQVPAAAPPPPGLPARPLHVRSSVPRTVLHCIRIRQALFFRPWRHVQGVRMRPHVRRARASPPGGALGRPWCLAGCQAVGRASSSTMRVSLAWSCTRPTDRPTPAPPPPAASRLQAAVEPAAGGRAAAAGYGLAPGRQPRRPVQAGRPGSGAGRECVLPAERGVGGKRRSAVAPLAEGGGFGWDGVAAAVCAPPQAPPAPAGGQAGRRGVGTCPVIFVSSCHLPLYLCAWVAASSVALRCARRHGKPPTPARSRIPTTDRLESAFGSM